MHEYEAGTEADLYPRFESREPAIITASLSPNPGQVEYRFLVNECDIIIRENLEVTLNTYVSIMQCLSSNTCIGVLPVLGAHFSSF